MEERSQPDSSQPHVTASTLAANLRVVSIRLASGEVDLSNGLSSRVNQIIELFIDKHWSSPRRHVQIRPRSFLLLPGPHADTFAEDVDVLTSQLERHLFGEGVEIKCLIGDAADMEAIAEKPAEAFVEAHDASTSEAKAKADKKGSEPLPHTSGDEAALASQLRLFAGYEASKNAVLCYVVSLGRGGYPAAPVLYDDVVEAAGFKSEAFEAAALRFAAARIIDRVKTGAVGYCLVPLSYESLADRRRRDAYLRMSAALPEDLRRFVLPSIFGGPLQPSTGFLMEICGALRQCYANFDWQTPSCALDPDPLRHAGVLATTLVLQNNLHERRIELARLPAFVRRLGAMRIRSGVAGLCSRMEIDEAIAARAHYLSGPAVSVEMPDLTPRIKLPPGALPIAA